MPSNLNLTEKQGKNMKRIGFIGWRGMVGSVLMERMKNEGDFELPYEPFFFTTSNVGGTPPDSGKEAPPLLDAYDLKSLSNLDIIVTCQGGTYTEKVYNRLRATGWNGYWIDAASTLRMDEKSEIVLDPVNRAVIDRAIADGVKTFTGGNCTVSLMLMALSGLLDQGLIEWISTMTYQAASGAGAQHMKELVKQFADISDYAGSLARDGASGALEVDSAVTARLRNKDFPVEHFGAPLAGSLIPWVDRAMASGQTREEWKGDAETNKILKVDPRIPVDGVCVRIGAMRCHSQGLMIKLRRDVSIDEVTDMIAGGNDWVEVVPNDKDSTLSELTPAAVNGTLAVPVGRIRKMLMGPGYLTAFTVGDQLLWGAAEPLRRTLRIILGALD
jgi:aspartate-semialdehyde dehydrogenase